MRRFATFGSTTVRNLIITAASVLLGAAGVSGAEADQNGCYPLNARSEHYLTSLRAAYGPAGVGDSLRTLRRVNDGFPVLDPTSITRSSSDSLCRVAAGAFARRLGDADSTRYLPITVLTVDTLGYAVSPHYNIGPSTLSMTFDRSWTQIGGTVWRDTTPASLPLVRSRRREKS